MSLKAIKWVLNQRVGSGYLKGTLMAIAICHSRGPVSRQLVKNAVDLSDPTITRHLRLLAARGLVSLTRTSVSLKMEAGS